LIHLNNNLPEDECIILLDFAENFSFVIQNAARGFHWDNSQATIYPFVLYHKESQTHQLEVKSVCIISDHLKHDTSVVHAFQKKVIPTVKAACALLKKVIYFSDSAASQYKNCKNFSNLCYHEKDFGVKAEWHFLQPHTVRVSHFVMELEALLKRSSKEKFTISHDRAHLDTNGSIYLGKLQH